MADDGAHDPAEAGEEAWLTAEEIGVRLSPARGKRAVLLWLKDPACGAKEERKGKTRCKVAQLSRVVAYLKSQGLDSKVAAPSHAAPAGIARGLFEAAINTEVEKRLAELGPVDMKALREWVGKTIADLKRNAPVQSQDAAEVDRWASALDKCQRSMRALEDHVFEAEKQRKLWISVEDHRAMMVRAAQDYVGDVEAIAAAQARELPGAIEPFVAPERREEARRVLAQKIKEVAGQVRAKRAAMMRAADTPAGAAA